MKLLDELKELYPGLSKKAKTHPLAAIRLTCLECMGGSKIEIENCTAECALHPFRKGKRSVPRKRKEKKNATV